MLEKVTLGSCSHSETTYRELTGYEYINYLSSGTIIPLPLVLDVSNPSNPSIYPSLSEEDLLCVVQELPEIPIFLALRIDLRGKWLKNYSSIKYYLYHKRGSAFSQPTAKQYFEVENLLPENMRK